MAAYDELMRPAYNAQYPDVFKVNVDDVISKDISDFKLIEYIDKWDRY